MPCPGPSVRAFGQAPSRAANLLDIARRFDGPNNPHQAQRRYCLNPPRLVPCCPTFRMKPGVMYGPERHNDMVRSIRSSTMSALTRIRRFAMTVQPFDNAAFEGMVLGLLTRDITIELCDAGTLIKERLP